MHVVTIFLSCLRKSHWEVFIMKALIYADISFSLVYMFSPNLSY
jgi:hypothetical protein